MLKCKVRLTVSRKSRGMENLKKQLVNYNQAHRPGSGLLCGLKIIACENVMLCPFQIQSTNHQWLVYQGLAAGLKGEIADTLKS